MSTETLSRDGRALRDERAVRWGMPSLAACVLFLGLPRLLPAAPPVPWPLFLLTAILAVRVGQALLRESCGMSPIAWICFRLAGDDPHEAQEQHRRRQRLHGDR